MSSYLENKIMRRVYVVYVLRKIFQPALVKVYIALALVWRAFQYVSISDIVTNASSALQPDKMYRFYTTAFANTEGVVQIAIVGVLLLAVWIVRDFAKRQDPLKLLEISRN